MGGLVTELKRRNVFRVVVAYLVLSWVLLQVADIVFPAFQLPEWSITFLSLMLIIGFIPAVIFSWAFELTPEGLKRERDVDRSQSVTNVTAKKLDIAVIFLLFIAIGTTFYNRTTEPPADNESAGRRTNSRDTRN